MALSRNYFEQTDGLIWVVDSADRSDRMLECKKELRALLQEEVHFIDLSVWLVHRS